MVLMAKNVQFFWAFFVTYLPAVSISVLDTRKRRKHHEKISFLLVWMNFFKYGKVKRNFIYILYLRTT